MFSILFFCFAFCPEFSFSVGTFVGRVEGQLVVDPLNSDHGLEITSITSGGWSLVLTVLLVLDSVVKSSSSSDPEGDDCSQAIDSCRGSSGSSGRCYPPENFLIYNCKFYDRTKRTELGNAPLAPAKTRQPHSHGPSHGGVFLIGPGPRSVPWQGPGPR